MSPGCLARSLDEAFARVKVAGSSGARSPYRGKLLAGAPGRRSQSPRAQSKPAPGPVAATDKTGRAGAQRPTAVIRQACRPIATDRSLRERVAGRRHPPPDRRARPIAAARVMRRAGPAVEIIRRTAPRPPDRARVTRRRAASSRDRGSRPGLDEDQVILARDQVRDAEQLSNPATPRPQMPVRLCRARWDDGDPDSVAL
jgi:hypothetical protein